VDGSNRDELGDMAREFVEKYARARVVQKYDKKIE
jgi:hypothetical protein